MSQTFTIDATLAGQTVTAAVKQFANVSWSQARRVIQTRKIKINSVICIDDTRRLKLADRIEIASQSASAPLAHDISIVHRDEYLVVIDKPAGIQTLRRREEFHWGETKKALSPTLDELLAQQLQQQVLDVHRLDRDTSGLMLFALSEDAKIALIRMFKRHQIRRTYLAVVIGRIDEEKTIETHIARDRGDGIRGSVDPPNPTAQRAITHIKPVEYLGNGCTLIECRLETGRTHQIRIHLSESGHPLAGETIYRKPSIDAPAADDPTNAPRQALHSTTLRFIHPLTNQPLFFESPLPIDLKKWLTPDH